LTHAFNISLLKLLIIQALYDSPHVNWFQIILCDNNFISFVLLQFFDEQILTVLREGTIKNLSLFWIFSTMLSSKENQKCIFSSFQSNAERSDPERFVLTIRQNILMSRIELLIMVCEGDIMSLDTAVIVE
jgi:hypothetical protein